MTKIFIGGSRSVTRLNDSITARLDNIINQNFTVLIGDAGGADKAVQKYLAEKSYGNVIVFCMNGTCRNNIGNWELQAVTAERGERGFEFYALKDLRMAEEATHGFMLWDGKSNGTLNNVANLLTRDKKVLVFFSPNQQFYSLLDQSDVADLLSVCSPNDLTAFDKKLALSERLNLDLPEFQLV